MMIPYSDFLNILQSLACYKKAEVVFEDLLISVEIRSKKQWVLKTKIGDQKMAYRESSHTYLHWDEEAQSLFLVQEIPPFATFLPFRFIFSNHLSLVKQWRDIALIA